MCQLPLDMGRGEGECIKIDSKGAFRPERLLAIAHLCVDQVLENIVYARAYNTVHQNKLLMGAAHDG